MIRVMLVDDQELVRTGIRGLLALTEDIRIVQEAADADDARSAILADPPDVLLLDVRLRGATGIHLLRMLGDAARLPPTILLTTFDDDDALIDGIRFGAKGFLLKDISLEQLAQGIRSVAGGESLWRPAITARVFAKLQERSGGFPSHDLPDRLTRREMEIWRLMAGGFSNREIADLLTASEGTIKNHVSSVLSKLGVRDRVRAVLRGIELGFL